MADLVEMHPRQLRERIRRGEYNGPTAGLARGYAQANLVVLHRDFLEDFLVYAARNPVPCPVIDVTDVGDPEPRIAGPGSDLRTDLGSYNVYRGGRLAEVIPRMDGLWGPDMVGILLGCSYTFEGALVRAGIPMRHVEAERIIPMYATDIPTRAAGPFSGPVVVTMRPIPAHQVARAAAVSARYAFAHGGPIHVGDPGRIGIPDLGRTDYGDPPAMVEGDVPVFWACGVTTQRAIQAAQPELAVAHTPAYMFVTDLLDEDLSGTRTVL